MDCGNALASDDSEPDFVKCPLQKAPKYPLAHRVQCHNSSAVLSSNKPLKIRIYCDSISRQPVKLDTFPVYLNTECEIRLLDNKAEKTETILLPQLATKFVQDRVLDVVPRTFTTIKPLVTTEITATTAAVVVVSTTTSATLALGIATDTPAWVTPVLSSVCGLFVIVIILIFCCLCPKCKSCRAVWKKCKPGLLFLGPRKQTKYKLLLRGF